MASAWEFGYDGYDPGQERLREALCTLGNGYVATRGAAPEAVADEHHYPGTYVAGVYNRLATTIDDHVIENESLVNQPNWLPLSFRTDGSEWFTPDGDAYRVLEYRQRLDMLAGILTRHLRVRDRHGHTTSVAQRRFVHMQDPHLAGLQTAFRAEDWSGTIEVRSALDGRVANTGVARYRDLDSDHLFLLEAAHDGPDTVVLEMRTSGSAIRVAEAARTRVLRDDTIVAPARAEIRDGALVGHDLEIPVSRNETVTVEKVVALFTSRDQGIYEPAFQARKWLTHTPDFESLLVRHRVAWDHLWRRYNVHVEDGDHAQVVLRLHVFHLLQTASDNTIDLDVGIPARGLHGEAYRGHIFWDELFIFPLVNFRTPILTRSLILYRHRRLTSAQWAAAEQGLRGACFPWQSSSDGREESQRLHLNPKSGRWLPDHSYLQRHINVAIAYNVWQYFEVTDDLAFMRYHGAPLLIEITRFLSSLATYDRVTDRYEILRVMGPDEFHDAYPDRDEPGLDNNAYTNVMTAWVAARTLELFDRLPPHHREELWESQGITREELDLWDDLSRRLYVPFHADGIISQFDGYDDLEEFDWLGYRERYGDIQRLDRILEAEGDTPNRFKLSKQADVLMLFYLLSEEELRETMERLGYEVSDDVVRHNVEYYLKRTSHGSTLSKVVHSWVLARTDRERSWRLFQEALDADVDDVQGGTTEEGIHLGAMAGTVDVLERCWTGLEARGGVLRLDPVLPEEVERLDFEIHYRGHRIRIDVTGERLRLSSRPAVADPVTVVVRGAAHELVPGGTVEVRLARTRRAADRSSEAPSDGLP